MYHSSPFLPVFQARHGAILAFQQYQHTHRKAPENLIRELNKAHAAYSGFVKTAAARRLQSAMDILIQISRVRIQHRPGGKRLPFRLGFWTLTVPDPIRTWEEVKKPFALFCQWLRELGASYVWKAELQERGQPHYHLIVDRYVPWKEISYAWNSRMKRAGLLQEFAQKFGHFGPNSVDARSVNFHKKIEKYLVKYISKSGERGPSKWWGASQNLLGKRFLFEPSHEELNRIDQAPMIEGEGGHWKLYLVDPMKVMSDYSKTNYSRWKRSVRKMGLENVDTTAWRGRRCKGSLKDAREVLPA